MLNDYAFKIMYLYIKKKKIKIYNYENFYKMSFLFLSILFI